MIASVFNQKYKILIICTLLVLGALIYSGTFYSSFHFDDIDSIVDNSAVRNIFNLKAIWDSWPTRFITYLSIALNYHFNHLKVFGYHAFNFLTHIGTAIMVWWFILLTFSTPSMRGKEISRHARLIAFFGGLVFMAHPIQTQAVTYIIQRATSLTAFFYLTCLNLYIKSRLLQERSEDPAVSRLFYCGSFVAALMAMFTKEIAITLPFIVLLYEASFLKKEGRLNWKYPFSFLAILPVIPLTVFFTKSVNFATLQRVQESTCNISPWHYLLTQFNVMVTYVRLLFIPINQNLDYDYHIAKSLLEFPTIASLIFLALILTIAIRLFSKHRLISFGIFWFFITLLPESSIVPIKDVIFEHRLYLPMVGFGLVLASGIWYLFKNKNLRLMVTVLLIITLSYAVLSYNRNLVWKNEFTLWNDAVRKSPEKARPYNNRGRAYYQQGDLSRSVSDFNKAIEINPNDAKSYNGNGIVYYKQGNFTGSIAVLNKAIKIDPDFTEAYYNRGLAYYQQGDLSRAVSDFNKAIEINPDDARPYNGHGLIYYKQGDFVGSIAVLNKAIKIDPDFTEAYYNRGLAYYQQGDLSRSVSDFNMAIDLDPNDARPYNGRGFIYAIQNNLTQAIIDFNKAIETDPDPAKAYHNCALAYYGNKEYDKALVYVRKAKALGAAIDPDFIDTLKKALKLPRR